jgi:hypothetical protein
MQVCITAYTSLSPDYPEYISINNNEGKLEITVRGPKLPATEGRKYPVSGHVATMALPWDEVPNFVASLQRAYDLQIAGIGAGPHRVGA